MKKYILLSSLSVLLFAANSKSQTHSKNVKTPYKIKIVDTQKGDTKGILYSVTDSSVIIISEMDYYKLKSSLNFQKK